MLRRIGQVLAKAEHGSPLRVSTGVARSGERNAGRGITRRPTPNGAW